MKKLCVIFGGSSSEHDISIITGLQLIKNLKETNSIEAIYLSLDNKFYLANNLEMTDFANKENLHLHEIMISNGSVYRKKFFKKLFDIDVVINCCHGGVGENGDLAAFFEINDIRYTSANPIASQILMNKSMTKKLVKEFANVVDGVLVNPKNLKQMKNYIREKMPDELIVKPNSLGSSIGVKVCSKENFSSQINAIFEMNDSALVERRLENMIELNQACVKDGDKLILSAIEQPVSSHDFLTFEDKYKHGKTKENDRIIPAKITKKLEEKITKTTSNIYEKLNLNGVVRVDYMFDLDSKTLYFNEVNTIPGSLAYYLFEPIGIDYLSLIELLIKNVTEPHKHTYFNTKILEKNILN